MDNVIKNTIFPILDSLNKNNLLKEKTELIYTCEGEEIKKNKTETKIKPFADKLNNYLGILVNFTNWIKESIKNSKDDASAACNDYLKILGLMALAYSWLKVLNVSYKEINNNKKFFEDKIETANFFFNRVLPRIDTHYKSAISGSKYIMDFKFS